MDQTRSSNIPRSREMEHYGNNASMHFPEALEPPFMGFFIENVS